MITECVTKEKTDYWKQLWQEKGSALRPNRMSGLLLNEYFQKKYSPTIYENHYFLEAVKYNLIERHGEKAADSSNIVCYLVDEDVYVGIDLSTGFFYIESDNTEKCVSIYDDMYVKRGLDKDDLQNYVYVGQYLELLGG